MYISCRYDRRFSPETGAVRMKIIDAHMHFSDNPGFCQVALAAKHENTSGHLVQAFKENNIVLGIAMGTRSGKRTRRSVIRALSTLPESLTKRITVSRPASPIAQGSTARN